MKFMERDEQILRVCYEHQFLDYDVAAKGFFDGRKDSSCRRLKLLTEAGLLKTERVKGDLTRRLIYRLTSTGREAAERLTTVRVRPVSRLKLATLDHDSMVTLSRIRISELWKGQWTPESNLKSEEYEEIPDGIFTFNSGAQVAIEIENSLKGRERYQRLFERWDRLRPFLVLYVVTPSCDYASIQRFVSDKPRGVPFALIKTETLLSSQPVAWTPAGQKAIFSKAEY